MADGEFLERHQVFLGNADDGREHPGLVFRILAVHIAGLPLERVHAQVGDHRAAEADQRVIPVAAFLDGEADFE